MVCCSVCNFDCDLFRTIYIFIYYMIIQIKLILKHFENFNMDYIDIVKIFLTSFCITCICLLVG